jgi:hypothetical protein
MLGHGSEIGGLLGSWGRSACRSGALVRVGRSWHPARANILSWMRPLVPG